MKLGFKIVKGIKIRPGDSIRLKGDFWPKIQGWDMNKIYKVDDNYCVMKGKNTFDGFNITSTLLYDDWELAMPDIYSEDV